MLKIKVQKIRLLIPLMIVGGLIVYTWIAIFERRIIVNWRHVIAFILYATIVFLFFKNRSRATLALGIFFLLGVCNVLALMPYISTARFLIGSFATPSFNVLSVCLFLLYVVLNLDALIDIEIDYSEKRKAKQAQKKDREQA